MSPLPCTGPLSINDIRTELQQSQGNNSLRTLSSLAGFSTPDAISEFYCYSYYNYRSFSIVNIRYGSYTEACESREEDNLTLYFYEAGGDGSPACPNISVTVYTDINLTAPFDGGGYWFKSNSCGASYNILGSPNRGFIEGISYC